MLYVVWVDSGPIVVTAELTNAINAANAAVGRSFVSKIQLGKIADSFASVIFWRKPDKSEYVSHWTDEESRLSYERHKRP